MGGDHLSLQFPPFPRLTKPVSKRQDLLIAVDGKSITGLTTFDAMVLIRGPKGSTVHLTVLHKDASTPVDISIVRATINLNSVSFEVKGDIAYIKNHPIYRTYR